MEVEILDPAHPLFGRRFPLLSVHKPRHSDGHVLVSYREYMALRVELSATDLAADARPATTPLATKLTSQSVTELAQLAEQCEVLLCPADPKTSGDDSHRNCERNS
jgi:hypothetical protein